MKVPIHISIKLSRQKIKRFATKLSVMVLIVAWIFSGWPPVWNFLPKMEKVYAATLTADCGTAANQDLASGAAWTTTGACDGSNNTRASFTVTGTGTGDYLVVTNFNFASIPNNSTVNGIEILIERNGTTSGANSVVDNSIVIRKADGTLGTTNKAVAGSWSATDEIVTRPTSGGSTDTWDLSWTVGDGNATTDIKDADFGVAISGKGASGSGNKTVVGSVDNVQITIHYTPPATVPDAPTSLTATAGDSEIDLAWTAPASDGGSAITGYKVYRDTASPATTLLDTIGVTTSYNDPTVSNGTEYFYRVKATNSVGDSDFSNEDSATPSVSASLTFIVNTDNFPNLTPGTYVFATSTLSVDTDNAGGWNATLSRDDTDTTLDLSTDASVNITDQTDWVPGADTSQAGNAVRLSLLDSSGDVLAFRLMTASGTTSFISTAWWGNIDAYVDDTSSFWSGIPETGQQIGNSTSDSGGSPALNTILYYLDVPSTQKTGTYNGDITFTATMN